MNDSRVRAEITTMVGVLVATAVAGAGAPALIGLSAASAYS